MFWRDVFPTASDLASRNSSDAACLAKKARTSVSLDAGSAQDNAKVSLDSGSAHENAKAEGQEWLSRFNRRLQHVLSHFNHHIHPRVAPGSEERRPLASCLGKGKQVCKSDFPLTSLLTTEPVFVCPGYAASKNLTQRGVKSLVCSVLPLRNDEWLNAGPRAWCAIAGSNADLKFPQKFPMLPETHEVALFDCRRGCLDQQSLFEMSSEMQATQSLIAGYFGGYTAKMQHIGQKELARLQTSLSRKASSESPAKVVDDFKKYSKRLVKDLEGKGIVRTAVESVNLALHANSPDFLQAESWRTFQTVTFPAPLFLKREEVETFKIAGVSVISAISHGRGIRHRVFAEAPVDLMYGFRGQEHCVDVLSPYEMLMHWSCVRILPPNARSDEVRFPFPNRCIRPGGCIPYSYISLIWTNPMGHSYLFGARPFW